MKTLIVLLVLSLPLFSQSNENCYECHSDNELTAVVNDSVEISAFVDSLVFNQSIHGELACTDCHGEFDELPHEDDLAKVDCGNCHEEEQEIYSGSVHGTEHESHVIHKAECADCHGTHNILPSDDKNSLTYKLNIAETCADCHLKKDVLDHLGFRNQGPVAAYKSSIHDQILLEDTEQIAPTCVSCHGAHNIYLMSDPRSTFNKLNRAETCGNCHAEIESQYKKSIHWQAVKLGHFESPTCNDCHGEHHIVSPADKSSITNPLHLSSQLCAKCHSSKTMMARFGLDPERFSSYLQTYHGMAYLKGSPEAANCTSCHEVHAIRSAQNPESSIYPDNLVNTCGKCHEQANKQFAEIEVHPVDLQSRNPIAFYVQNIYFWLVIAVLGGMALHNLIIFSYYVRKKYREQKSQKMLRRFKRFEVYQHLLMVVSFIVLAITGFALKFPDSFWVEWLSAAGLSETVRALIHRISAVIMIAISLVQMSYFMFKRSGRKEISALMPTISDFKHLVQNIRFHLFISKEKPKFGRFDYAEKAEYLALIWGVAVMAITGFILWFPEFFATNMPWWVFEVAQIIHLFEAILATLAIVIWHWFFVIYHPENYPMNLTFVDGKVSEQDLLEHHPAEYDEIKKIEPRSIEEIPSDQKTADIK